MSSLHTTCWPCARKLGLNSTLLPALGERPCEGCGATVGYKFENGPELRDDAGKHVGYWPVSRGLTQAYCHFWQRDAWPIAWGLAMQDNYGTHEHEWSMNYANYQTGERRENCRCGERRTTSAPPKETP